MSSHEDILITPLGAGQEVGRSCIVVKIKDRTVIFDTGIHMQYSDMQKYPDFSHICGEGDINNYVDVVIITHFHLDHCGGLPYLTEHFKYKGPIFSTMPTKAMIPYMLEDFRKVTENIKTNKDNMFQYSASEAKWAAEKITSIALEQTVYCKGMKITPYYAGHVLGAGMFLVEYEGLSVMYTGDYNSYADRHLGAAQAPRLNPNVILTETTYATTIRDTKRDRERKMLKIVSETVEKGGKVLIPVFALGRAQELSVLLETYWNRTDNTVPVYFSAGLIEKANFYYKLFVEWENEKIKEDFLTNNLFNFKKVKPFDKTLIKAEGPYVLFATPGMLHGGTSLQVFKEWCGDAKNTIIIPGYCVPGTFGNKLLNGIKKLEIDHKEYEVNMKVENISFSAHADAKGIINLIRHVNAENIVFVHGDKTKMEIFEEVVKEQLDRPVYRPANKETIKISCSVRKEVVVQGEGLGIQGYLLRQNLPRVQQNTMENHPISNKNLNNFKTIPQERLMEEINLLKELLDCDCESFIVSEEVETSFKVCDSGLRAKIEGFGKEKEKEGRGEREMVGEGEEMEDEGKSGVKKEEEEEDCAVKNFVEDNSIKSNGNEYVIEGDLKNVLKIINSAKEK